MEIEKNGHNDEIKKEKIELLKLALFDHILMEDIIEIQGDFISVDFETLDSVE